MKCIDAVEGVIITILKEYFSEYCYSRDDSEYTGNVKIIIKSSDKFVREHKEIIGDPEIIKKIFYEFSRDLWVNDMMKKHAPEEIDLEDKKEYYIYYFDYLYNHGVYPQ